MGTITVTVTNEDPKQDFKTVIKTTKDLLKFIFRYKEARKYAGITLFTTIVNFLFSFTMTIIPGLLVNELTNTKRTEMIVFYVLFISGNALLRAVINRFFAVKVVDFKNTTVAKLIREFNLKSASLDYEELENPETQAESARASGSISSSLIIVDNIIDLFSSALYFIGTTAVFSTVNPLLLLSIVAVVTVNSIVTKSVNKKLHDNNVKKSRKSLYQSYLSIVLFFINYAKEIRIFDSKRFFADGLFNNKNEINQIINDDAKINSNAAIIFGATGFFQTALLYVYFIYKVLFDSMQVGNMLIYLNSVSLFSSSLSGIINGYLRIAGDSLGDREMLDYMNRQPMQYRLGSKTPVVNDNSVFEFRNVTFRYSGSERYALENVNMKFKAKERLCLVGENGAGKTTFIKLLLRLYLPTSGEILLDGVNINDFDYEQYLKIFSAVFQDYQLYPLNLKENISFDNQCDDKKVTRCINQVGLAELVSKLPKGIETSLYKYLDPEGFVPSGGEAQRIAIARALYHGREIYILDEPTAALDPNAEYEIYMQFHNMVQGKTAIFVTHRLSAVQLADNVAVFDNGYIAEYGTHAELYAKGGIYAEMFDKQAHFYRDNKNEIVNLDEVL